MPKWLALLFLAAAALSAQAAQAIDPAPRYMNRWSIPDSLIHLDDYNCGTPHYWFDEYPTSVATDFAGHVWVTSSYWTCDPDIGSTPAFFRRYDAHGVMEEEWRSVLGFQYLGYPPYAAGLTGDLYAVGYQSASGFYGLNRITPAGQVIGLWPLASYGYGEWIACDPLGMVFLAGHGQIEMFDADGNLLGTLDDPQYRANGPITTDAFGHLFLYNYQLGQIRVVDYGPDGWMGWNYAFFGSKGSAPGQFNDVTSMACDADGRLYVCDYGNARIEKFIGSGIHANTLLLDWKPTNEAGGTFSPGSMALDSQGYLYVLGGQVYRYATSAVVDVSPPVADVKFGLRGVAPQPARGQVAISFTAPGSGAAKLEIFDLAGRRVRSLPAGAESGPRSVTWDGRDATGAAAPSGAYLVRLTWPGGSDQRKLMLLR